MKSRNYSDEEQFFAENREIDKGIEKNEKDKEDDANNDNNNNNELDPLDAFMLEINQMLEEQKQADAEKTKEYKKCEQEYNERETKSDNESSLDDNDATADICEFIEKKRELEEKEMNNEKGEDEKNKIDGLFKIEKNMNDEVIIESINYSTKKLKTFQKDIFITDKNTMDFTLEQSVEYKKKNNIVATGFSIPKPLFSFLQITNLINEDLLQSWYDQSFYNLSPIQSVILPVFLSGRDFIAISRTGSGKTLSFIIALTIHLLYLKKKNVETEYTEDRLKNIMKKEKEEKEEKEENEENERKEVKGENAKEEDENRNITEEKIHDYPHAVILTPTKELCFQIYEEMNRISLNQVKSCILFRGLDYQKTYNQIRKGVDVIICNTKILVHFVNKKMIYLENVKYFILDEFDKLFEKQNFLSLVSILSNSRPDSIKALYTSIVTDYMIEKIKPYLNKKFITIKIGDKNNLITQNFVVTQENKKYDCIVKYLLENKKVVLEKNQGIIFCNNKKNIMYLCERLKREEFLSPIVFNYIHGDIDQAERINIFKKFKKKHIHILISSDLMSRGIDVTDINFVINYDCPSSIFSYIHRIGRCSRTNNQGNAITLITLADKKAAYCIYNHLKEKNEPIDEELKKFIRSIGRIESYANSKNINAGINQKRHINEYIKNNLSEPPSKICKSIDKKMIALNTSFKKSTIVNNHDAILKDLNVINPDDVLTSSSEED